MVEKVETEVILTLRHQAWERAKGDLRAVLQTFWDRTPQFKELDKAVDEFIEFVDGNELA